MMKLKKPAFALSLLILLLVAGCEDPERIAKNEAIFKACVDSGGVPIQSWYDEKVLGDCKYRPEYGCN